LGRHYVPGRYFFEQGIDVHRILKSRAMIAVVPSLLTAMIAVGAGVCVGSQVSDVEAAGAATITVAYDADAGDFVLRQ